jgi:ACS family hexuronate transporter-like MFS transporter
MTTTLQPPTPREGIHAPAAARATTGVGWYRWVVCFLLFLAATINYIDRQVIGLLKPTLQQQFGWSEIDYADIVFSFQLAYAIGLLLAGRFIDRVGTRIGFTMAVAVWSIAAMAHAEAPAYGPAAAAVLGAVGLAYAPTVAGFIAARFALGIGEAGNFPAAIKAVAEWFPMKERAFATGLFNSGTNIGAVMAPLMVPWITVTYGWYWAFVATGAIGFLWIALWLPLFAPPERHPRVSAAELAHIQSDPSPPVARVPLRALLPHRQTWAFAIGKFMTDPIWWLYLFWVPDFLNRNHGLNLLAVGPPLVAIYLIADIGSIGGGWLSSALLKRGWSVNAARKTAMLASACAVIPIVFASVATNLWVAVLLVALAAAAHQGWSANLFTLSSDLFPRQAVGTVVGFGGMAGAVGGMLIAKLTGYLLETTGSYVPVFLIAGTAYLTALLIVHLLAPRLEKVDLARPA